MMRSVGALAARVRDVQENVRAGAAELLALAAEQTARDARRLAPVDTGRLRESISAGLLSPDEAVVTAGAPYAACVEYGTSQAPAQPFLLPAAQDMQDELPRMARRVFGKGGRI